MEEKDLYLPVKTLFTSLGFTVHGEVKTVDVVAIRDDLVVAIELKKDLSLHLIAQGAYRQRLTDHVYIAVPTPTKRSLKGAAYKDKVYLLKRLGIGLIFVTFSKKKNTSTIILEPNLLDIKASQSRNKKRKLALQTEIANRHTDYNLGGSRGKIMTAYKEASIRLIGHMADGATYESRHLRKLTGNPKATKILYNNYYGWFKRVDQGRYALSPLGLKAIKDNEHYLTMYNESPLEPNT